jgi:hypothetical protein
MKALLVRSSIALVPGLIVSGGFVLWSFILTGGWPPEYLMVASSVGVMLSPLFWELARRIRRRPRSGLSEDR